MSLAELLARRVPPLPFAEGPKIPWNDPAFSERMLAEHLSQAHDGASRRRPIIERQVAWIHETVLAGRPSRILDLGCGPGLYLNALAELGHEGLGLDYSPASIRYAKEQASALDKPPRYRREDILSADFEAGFDLILLLYGEFNAFSKDETYKLLNKSRAALARGGKLLLEVHHGAFIEAKGQCPPSWKTQPTGLFCPAPHLYLEEHFFNSVTHTATTRFFVVESESGRLSSYAETLQAYLKEEYEALFAKAGFAKRRTFPTFDPASLETPRDLFVFLLEPSEQAV